MPDKGTQFPEVIKLDDSQDTQIPNDDMNHQEVVEDSEDSDPDDYSGWIAKKYNDVSLRWRNRQHAEDIKANWNRVYFASNPSDVKKIISSPCVHPPLTVDSQDKPPINDCVVSSIIVPIDDSQDIEVQTPQNETKEESDITDEEIKDMQLKLKKYYGRI